MTINAKDTLAYLKHQTLWRSFDTWQEPTVERLFLSDALSDDFKSVMGLSMIWMARYTDAIEWLRRNVDEGESLYSEHKKQFESLIFNKANTLRHALTAFNIAQNTDMELRVPLLKEIFDMFGGDASSELKLVVFGLIRDSSPEKQQIRFVQDSTLAFLNSFEADTIT